MRIRLLAGLVLPLLLAGCRGSSTPADGGTNRVGSAGAGQALSGPTVMGDWFTDLAQQTGLDFVHVNGMSGQWYFPEMMGPGVALLDYDSDGDLDVYIVQGRRLGPSALSGHEAVETAAGRLFRNDLVVNDDGTRTLRFTDVTEQSGITATGYGMGVATGDFNNDGCIDLYLSAFGRNQMFRNNCDGTFTDVSRRAGVDDSGWSVSASFLDFDRDGWLDLYVGHYLNYKIAGKRDCFNVSGRPDYCSPNAYRAQPSHLYHNNRDGTFTDVTAAAGLAGQFGPGLGVVAADFNGDGWVDLYVANDGQENQLWTNQRDGTLRNTGPLSGSALTADGKAAGSMGVDAGDFDGDGDEDLLVTTLMAEGSTLLVNSGSGFFEDLGTRSGLRPASLASTGFGAAWFDFDNDGRLDVLTVNGAVRTIEALAQARDPFPLHQRKQLFRNLGGGRFEEVTGRAGAVFQLSEVGRGAAFGDIDNDGDVDVVVANNNGRARLLVNNIGNHNHWIGLRLIGEIARHRPTRSARSGSTPSAVEPSTSPEPPEPMKGRDMLGARVGIVRQDGSTVWRRARADGSYASANDPRVIAGLGQSAAACGVRVIWPDGRSEAWDGVAFDRYTTLKEGTGK